MIALQPQRPQMSRRGVSRAWSISFGTSFSTKEQISAYWLLYTRQFFASDESLTLQSKQAISQTVPRFKFIKRHITLRERGSKFLIRHDLLLLKMQNLGEFILPTVEVFISYCVRFFYYHTNRLCTKSSCVVMSWERFGTIKKHVTDYIVEII